MDAIRSVMVPIHREGWRFVAIFAVISAVLFALWEPFGVIGLVLTAWCLYFFRDPERHVPTREGLVVSPADGVVSLIERAVPPPELEMGDAPRMRISVFLNVFNVHVNRVPVGGVIAKSVYRPGKFLNASLDKASEENERQALRIDMENGEKVSRWSRSRGWWRGASSARSRKARLSRAASASGSSGSAADATSI